jgi:hypothetical protein
VNNVHDEEQSCLPSEVNDDRVQSVGQKKIVKDGASQF